MVDIENIDPKYLELMMEPRNYGKLTHHNAKGTGKNELTKEMVVLYMHIEDGTVRDIAFQTNGCGTTLVSGSMFTDYYKNKTLDEGIAFTNEVFEKLKDNPPLDAACGEVVARAFEAAVQNFNDKQEHIAYVTLSCPTDEEADETQ